MYFEKNIKLKKEELILIVNNCYNISSKICTYIYICVHACIRTCMYTISLFQCCNNMTITYTYNHVYITYTHTYTQTQILKKFCSLIYSFFYGLAL